MTENLRLLVSGKKSLTDTICEFTLADADGRTLPASEPGAHIGVETPTGAWRQYSLVDSEKTPLSYRIAVKREADGRGGSAALHDQVAQGDRIAIQPPTNKFALSEAPEYMLIAGGIGITPIYSMAKALRAAGRPLRLVYCARSIEEAAYANELAELLGDRLTLHLDDGDPTRVYDFWDHFAEPGKAHVFCCGPAPLMEEIRAISGHWPDGSVHFEDFAGAAAIQQDDRSFRLTLARSGRSIDIPANRTILETLRAEGVSVRSSCESGTCGTCKCGLVSGDVNHRDMVLMDEEKSHSIIICVSRARSGELVLDL